MAQFVKRVTVIDSHGEARTIYRDKGKKRKKVSRLFRPAERAGFRVIKAADTFTGDLLNRYRRSRTKRRNGWLRNAPRNWMKASRKALKKLSRI